MRRQAFLNDGAEPRVADAAAAALLKAWAASKPDAAQAAAAGSALAESLDAGLLNVVAAYLPPRGDAVLGASAAAFAAEVLPRLAAKASTGDAALDKLATPLLIAAALTAPVSHERAAFLADLLEAPLSALLKSDDGAGDVFVKVATGHVELFKDAVGRLSPSALADVKAGMGRARRGRGRRSSRSSPAGVVCAVGSNCGQKCAAHSQSMVLYVPIVATVLFSLMTPARLLNYNPPSFEGASIGRCVGFARPKLEKSPRRQRSRHRCAGASAWAPPTARSPRPCPRAPPRPSRARRRSSRTPSAAATPPSTVGWASTSSLVARLGDRGRRRARRSSVSTSTSSSSDDESSSEEDVPTPAPRLCGVPFA